MEILEVNTLIHDMYNKNIYYLLKDNYFYKDIKEKILVDIYRYDKNKKVYIFSKSSYKKIDYFLNMCYKCLCGTKDIDFYITDNKEISFFSYFESYRRRNKKNNN